MSQAQRAALRAAALEIAGRGWKVFPCRPGTKAACWHGKDDCPASGVCAAGHVTPESLATSDLDKVGAKWSEPVPYNIALFPGPSCLFLLDCDQPKPGHKGEHDPDGWTQLQALAAERGGPLPDTYTVTTPTGGRHLLYTAPPGCHLRSTVKHLASNIDTRGWGGYALAPGSLRPDGAYELLDDTEPVELPGWLVQATVERASTAVSGRDQTAVAAPSSYVAAAVQAECDRVRSAPPGTRNKALSTAAYALGQLAGARLLDETYARAELRAAVAAWNTPESAVKDDGVIGTALRAGAENPRRIKPRHGTRRAA
ncbi:bifunctional DNA primase/polymerase [Amycolatopsis sp. FDAARGOS 1241]|uniref:bifunctional DNA primase/polymerase n=1 Tax=Amycolatopsis sp. FDAARGOS 1241 TaxID=2778070 RepID=UPI00194DD740|nr:bifunctional DNA primase/polymerase [Amycolatopsis sp. FDAARGOS 1241]QRP47428.1 bifunctional DNA primase/polymerase [Amycolatopsis sp. FDAARGOS 1241]